VHKKANIKAHSASSLTVSPKLVTALSSHMLPVSLKMQFVILQFIG